MYKAASYSNCHPSLSIRILFPISKYIRLVLACRTVWIPKSTNSKLQQSIRIRPHQNIEHQVGEIQLTRDLQWQQEINVQGAH